MANRTAALFSVARHEADVARIAAAVLFRAANTYGARRACVLAFFQGIAAGDYKRFRNRFLRRVDVAGELGDIAGNEGNEGAFVLEYHVPGSSERKEKEKERCWCLHFGGYAMDGGPGTQGAGARWRVL